MVIAEPGSKRAAAFTLDEACDSLGRSASSNCLPTGFPSPLVELRRLVDSVLATAGDAVAGMDA